MGQLISIDKIPQLPVSIPEDNIKIPSKIKKFLICPYLSCRSYERIFYFQTENEIQAIYRFGIRFTVYLQLKKQEVKKQQGIYIQLADEYVYAYKHKKLDKSQKIKPQKILFKKRMYVYQNQYEFKEMSKQVLLCKFVQTKYLSLLQIGPQLGRVYNGSDGIITDQYIQYFSEITIEKIQTCIAKNSQLQIFQKKLNNLKLDPKQLINIQNLSNLTYSQSKKGYIFKLNHYYEKGINKGSEIRHSYQNKSIHYLVRMFETQINQVIMQLDNQGRMLPYINNLIFQNQFDKAIIKMEQNLNEIQDENQKISYGQQINSMISKHSQGNSLINNKQYQNKIKNIINLSVSSSSSILVKKSYLTTSKTLKQSNLTNHLTFQKQINYNSKIQMTRTTLRLTPKKHKRKILKSPISHKIIQTQTQLIQKQKNNPYFIMLSSVKSTTELVYSQKQTKSIFKQKTNLQQKHKAFLILSKCLKNSILDKDKQKTNKILQQMNQLDYKSSIQIKILFGKILMQTGRSRHALSIFEKLLYFSNKIGSDEIYLFYQIGLLNGILLYQRYQFVKSLKSFQKSLSILIKLKHYSTKMMTIYNNIACVNYLMQQYDTAIMNLHRGFKLGQYSADFQFLMRSNRAMILVEKGMVKQAKIQMLKTNKIVQPVNNMIIFCKFYSNLAYIQLLQNGDSKGFQKAMINFQQACMIQQKYLIPNGYKASVFLHNNMSMLYYRRKQFKKAKFQCEKIFQLLNQIPEKMVAIKVHFNIGKIFSHGYNYDIPLKHFQQAWILLGKIDQSNNHKIKFYKEIVKKEIQELQKMKIDQVSEQQSYKFSYMSNSLLKKI